MSDPLDTAVERPDPHGRWDDVYREQERIWSGRPNWALVTLVADLPPGRALDVGCGEGADAIWLAERGWQVTALDPSAVALERLDAAAGEAGVAVATELATLETTDLPHGVHDLVTVSYPALPLDTDPLRRLVELVAPGGVLLVVHHADIDRERALSHGFDPDTLLGPADVAPHLGPGWEVVLDERRPRQITGGAGQHHRDDHVVLARRRPPGGVVVRRATTHDVRAIRDLVRPLAGDRVLLNKEAVAYYEAVPEFRVAEVDGVVVGCGAVHVMWDDLAEIRTLAVSGSHLGLGVGGRILEQLVADARTYGVSRLFCLTFEVDFFTRHGFTAIEGQAVEPDVYLELLRSYDEGVAEFLDLERVKPNTLGNTRMLRAL